MKTVQINLNKGLAIEVLGTYTEGEPDVGLSPSFDIRKILIVRGNVFEIIEWTEAQNGNALTYIAQMCINLIND